MYNAHCTYTQIASDCICICIERRKFTVTLLPPFCQFAQCLSISPYLINRIGNVVSTNAKIPYSRVEGLKNVTRCGSFLFRFVSFDGEIAMDAINDLAHRSMLKIYRSVCTALHCIAKCMGIKVLASHTHIHPSFGTSNGKGE